MPRVPDYIGYPELQTPRAISTILKNDIEIKEMFTNNIQPNFNIYSNSLVTRKIAYVNNRALAIYFPNKVNYSYPSLNYKKRELEIFCEVAVQRPHKEYGEDQAQYESFQISSDIINTLENNKTARVILNNPVTGLDEAFQVGRILSKGTEPLLIGAINNFWTYITLTTFEVLTS